MVLLGGKFAMMIMCRRKDGREERGECKVVRGVTMKFERCIGSEMERERRKGRVGGKKYEEIKG